MANLTPEQVRAAYLQLLGREPEHEGLWADADAVSALLDIAASEEHRNHIKRQMASEGRFQTAEANGIYFVTYSADQVIGESLRLGGEFEEGSVETVMELLEANGYQVGRDTFVDVGANIGTHSIKALNSGFARAICIEADPDNFKLLKINQILNDLDGRCINFLAAASETDDELLIELSPTNFGDHRIRVGTQSNSIHGEEEWRTQKVTGRPLDAMLGEALGKGTGPSLVWIDTQGHEAQVLAGAPSLISSDAPIVVEFWPYGLSRAGGLVPFLDLIRQRKIYDLRQSQNAKALIAVAPKELERIFHEMLEKEADGVSPHTDLLLL